MMPTLRLHHGALWVDHSGFFEPKMQCDQKHAYHFLHKRIKAEEPIATLFGTCIHSVLEYRYKIHGTGKVDEGGRAVMSSIIQRHFDANPSPFGDRRNLSFAEEITIRYLEKYPTEEFQLLEFEEAKKCQHCDGRDRTVEAGDENHEGDDKYTPCPYCNATGLIRAMVELPFTVNLFVWEGWLPSMCLSEDFPVAQILDECEDDIQVNIPVYYIGKIDLPLLRNGQLYVMDHKTTSVLDKNFFYAKKASQQTKMYCYAMQETTGMKVDGYAINVIHTKEVPDYVTSGKPFKGVKKTPQQYWDEALTRQFHSVTQEELEGAKNNAINLCEEFFWNYSRGIFPRSSSDSVCVPKYGPCPYYTVCHEVAETDRLSYLASGAYMNSEWTPLNKITE